MTDTLTHRTVKNSIYSLIGFVWPLLLSFVATPIIIRSLGSSRFGFYALLNSVPTIFGLLDFGLNFTFIKQLSENRTNQKDHELSVTFSTTTILYVILGIVVMSLLFLLQGSFRYWFKIPEGFISSYGLAFFVLGTAFLLQMITVPISQIPYALQRQDVSAKISIVNNTFLQVGSIVVLKTGHGILALLVMQLISASFALLSYYLAWHRIAPDLKFVPKWSKQTIQTIGREGFWVYIRNNTWNILAQLDKFVLGAIWGPAAVGYYSTAQMIPEKISSTSFSLSHLFFPIFSEVSAQEKEGEQRIRVIFRRSFAIISIITTGLAVLVVLYGYKLLHYWIGMDFAEKTIVTVPLLAITFLLLSFGNFLQAFLSGLKELKFLALSTLVVAVIDVVLMFILIPRYSINGAAVAYLLSAVPMLAYLYYIERKYLGSGAVDITAFYGKLFGKIFIVSSLVSVLGWLFIRPFMTNLVLVMLLGGSTFFVYLLLYWVLNFYSSEDKELIKSYILKFLEFFQVKK